MPNKPQFRHTTEFLSDAVSLIQTAAAEAIAARGRFIVSLSGGNTPKPVYEALARSAQDWDKWVITFGDERCVPPEDSQSNFRMAKESFFDHLGGATPQILRMKGELDPAVGARDYEKSLQELAGGEPILRHDLILLGMGPDGHTASLFPGTPALHEHTRRVIENYVPKFSMWRITFTYPMINAARQVCFLVSRAGKEGVLDQVQRGEGDYPCRHVRPAEGKLVWLIGE